MSPYDTESREGDCLPDDVSASDHCCSHAGSWHCASRVFTLERPLVMGILNVTPDSFSDGGLYATPDNALAHASEMLEAGADIIDVGGESTRPGSREVTVADELARVLPVIRGLAEHEVVVSVDTRHAQVAEAAVEAGASIINDVSGFRAPAMRAVAASCDAGLIVMHMAGTPETMQADPHYDDVVSEVRAYLLQQARLLEAEGVERERICLDPGPGFGKTAAHNLEILARFDELCDAAYPMMVATSRKGFIGTCFGKPEPSERVWGSVATAIEAVAKGAAVARVHDVAETTEAFEWLGKPPARVAIALGANEGDRIMALVWARRRIAALPYTEVLAGSAIYASEPAYNEDQPAFANAMLFVRTRLHPQVLLAELQRLELTAGRVRTFPNAPRPLDLDIVDYGGVVSTGETLTLPHPLALERDFVVKPLLELDPDYVLADGTSVGGEAVRYGMVGGILLPASSW